MHIPQGQLGSLRKLAKSYPPDITLCLEGEKTQDLILLLSGHVAVIRGEDEINIIEDRNVFLGHLSFFARGRRTATLRTKTNCDIVRIRSDKVEDLLKTAPNITMRLLRDVTELLLKKEREIEEIRATHAANPTTNLLQTAWPSLATLLLDGREDAAGTSVLGWLHSGLKDSLELEDLEVNQDDIPSEILDADARAAIERSMDRIRRQRKELDEDRARRKDPDELTPREELLLSLSFDN